MTEATENARQRDRSPAYPIIPLETALERLVTFDSHFKRVAARPGKVGEAWGIKAKAYASRTLAALRYFGLINYQGSGKDRSVVVSDEGRKYLRAQQEITKREVITAAALRPQQIAKFWDHWGTDQPADPVCLDELVLNNRFSEGGARGFLKVYKDTIAFALLSSFDKVELESQNDEKGIEEKLGRVDPPSPPVLGNKAKLMAGERELTAGLLSKEASFRLIVSGQIGVKEIKRLIKKLEIDRDILAEMDDQADDEQEEAD